MPLFGGKNKSPTELIKSVKDCITILNKTSEEGDEKRSAKATEDLSKTLDCIKITLCGSGDHEPNAESASQLTQEIYNSRVLVLIVDNLSLVDFEGRKDFVAIFNNLLRRQIGQRYSTVEHILQHKNVLTSLLGGYKVHDIALSCGLMLRECFRHEELARIVLHSEDLFKFFEYVEVSTFDISSDAFLTFKDLLTRHKGISAEFLEANYEKFFTQYQRLLNSDNYVTKRQALKLLGELLLDRKNFNVMTKYVSHTDNLKLMMNLLKEDSKNIQFEAFHVFKVFVANPDKTRPVQDILLRNKDRLVEFLTKFHSDRMEDEQFNDEKAYLIKQIKELKPLDPLPASAAVPAGEVKNTGESLEAGVQGVNLGAEAKLSDKTDEKRTNTAAAAPVTTAAAMAVGSAAKESTNVISKTVKPS